MPRTTLWPVLLTSLLLACGGKSFDNGGEPEGGSGNSGGSAQAGSSSAGTESGGSSSGGTGSGGSSRGGTSSAGTSSGGAAQCDASEYADDRLGGNVGVRLINGTKHVIYLGEQMLGCGSGPQFQVADGSGRPLPNVGFCQSTCEMMIKGEVIGCPAIACAIGSTLTLQPGESTIQQWNTLYTEQVTLPPVCRAKTGTSDCQRIVSAKPGAYIFSAQAGTGMKCDPPDSMMCATCQPNNNGGCNTYGAVITGPLINAKTAVMLDGSYGLGGPGGGMARQVEVTFMD